MTLDADPPAETRPSAVAAAPGGVVSSADAAALPAPAAGSDRGLERRAAILLLGLLLLVCGAAAYLLYARGVFEPTQRLVLVAEDSEGVVVGMNLTFSGFAIGRVRRIELVEDGSAQIVIDVAQRDAHWLRTSSVFTLSRGLVGNTAIRAYSGILADPPLPEGAVRKVLTGDATAEIPRLVASARELVQNLSALTAADAALATTLANAQAVTQSLATKLNAQGGVMGVLTGNVSDSDKLRTALDRANQLLSRLDGLVGTTDGVMRKADGLVGKADGLVGRADAQIFGPAGLATDAKASVAHLNGLLGEARGSLKKVDALLEEAQGVARNARVASADLGQLRAEVDASLRKVEQLVNEINRKWPFARDTEIKLP